MYDYTVITPELRNHEFATMDYVEMLVTARQ